MKALQAVVACLGGIVGSIVGYYFGESAGRKAENDYLRTNRNTSPDSEAVTPVTSGTIAPTETATEISLSVNDKQKD